MCLVLIALDSHPDYSLIVAANRDEFYDRPTAPAAFWADAPSVLAGRDLKAGGTWLGIDRRGRLAAVTNYRQGEREPPALRSRGRLVSDFLTADTGALEYVERVQSDANLYNGFNLIASDAGELFYYSNREGRVRTLGPGVYGLSNHLLDTPWPKVASTKSAFGALLKGGASELTADLFGLLSDRDRPADDLLPSTGIEREWEQVLSSAFIASNDYGTRSSTVVLVGRDGSIVFVEHNFGPGGAPGGEARFEMDGREGGKAGRR
ncbi:MAG TPA: NRDE family protein [Gemmatimonadales bacterium]